MFEIIQQFYFTHFTGTTPKCMGKQISKNLVIDFSYAFWWKNILTPPYFWS